MFLDSLGEMLPAAIAVALSPFPVIAVVLVLGTPAAVRNGLWFALGWVVGLSALTALVLVVVGRADGESGTSSNTLLSVFRVVVGVLLIVLAWKKWAGRRRRGEEPTMPPWMAGVEQITSARALRLGAILGGVNPKNFALAMSAMVAVAGATTDGGRAWVAALIFVAIGSGAVVGAVAARLILGDRAADPLDEVKRFMLDNNVVIMMIVLLVLGAKILGDGLAGLGT